MDSGFKTIPKSPHRTEGEYQNVALLDFQNNYWPDLDLYSGNISNFLIGVSVLYIEDENPIRKYDDEDLPKFLATKASAIRHHFPALVWYGNNLTEINNLALIKPSDPNEIEKRKLRALAAFCENVKKDPRYQNYTIYQTTSVNYWSENDRMEEGYLDTYWPMYYYIKKYFDKESSSTRWRDDLRARTTEMYNIDRERLTEQYAQEQFGLLILQARSFIRGKVLGVVLGAEPVDSDWKSRPDARRPPPITPRQLTQELYDFVSGLTETVRGLGLRSRSTELLPVDQLERAATEFGKVLKPYRKHINKADSKGIWFNTNFGKKKLKCDKVGLFIKAKGKKFYLYRWSAL